MHLNFDTLTRKTTDINKRGYCFCYYLFKLIIIVGSHNDNRADNGY